ncbi:hypothetical protein N7449_010248 [Penicillium cf. viridicatum]|uniref:Uncharacterized protein n=1 Tax=Penicillium cf. viridicatum TaxID=2972119 RepID=A0A9W9M3E6_9EURO|nr:hypothetical protein N7449_010248 [Penicillium cf. viridicatum]
MSTIVRTNTLYRLRETGKPRGHHGARDNGAWGTAITTVSWMSFVSMILDSGATPPYLPGGSVPEKIPTGEI